MSEHNEPVVKTDGWETAIRAFFKSDFPHVSPSFCDSFIPIVRKLRAEAAALGARTMRDKIKNVFASYGVSPVNRTPEQTIWDDAEEHFYKKVKEAARAAEAAVGEEYKV